MGLNKRDPTVFDMWRIDILTGEATIDTENPGKPRCVRALVPS